VDSTFLRLIGRMARMTEEFEGAWTGIVCRNCGNARRPRDCKDGICRECREAENDE